MPEQQYETRTMPDVVLILGTDGAGKDHVANILENMIREAGGKVEKRRGFLSGRASRTKDSTRKSAWDYVQEVLFLFLYRRVGFLIPFLLYILIRLDTALFTQPEGKLIVVGHHGLRALAFHMGAQRLHGDSLIVPSWLKAGFDRMQRKIAMKTIVIDVSEAIRKKRLTARRATGDQDFFDRYMLKNAALGEGIEGALVGLAEKYFDAVVINNDDLTEAEIKEKLRQRL